MGDSDTSLWREALDVVERLADAEPATLAAEFERLAAEAPSLYARVKLLSNATAEVSEAPPGLRCAAFEPADLTGQPVGAWRFVREIGRGGMGQVWLAERADSRFEGQVAVKLLAASTHPALVERFRREGQLLGRLQHPHIARLLDAGALPSGQLYLVLEYVEGERIDAYCDRRQLGIAERLALMRQVCEAVSHAHANLVVHRDLKPSNVLVSEQGHVKLLDFGIATLLDEADADAVETELTRRGGRAMTPEYAAPEQINGAPVTMATDVYALGVMLYLLLTGRRPYGDPALTPAQLAGAILETEPVRVSAAAAQTQGAAERRGLSAERLQRSLRGDLDNIVAKALKKLPAERYATVQALSDDLRRHLNHEPVSVQVDSWAYRTRKFVRRHRLGVAASSALVLTLVAGLVGVGWQARIASLQAAKAGALNAFLLDLFRGNDPRTGLGAASRQTTAEELLKRGARQLQTHFGEQPAVRAALATTLHDLMHNIDLYDEAIALTLGEVDHLTRHHGPDDPALVEPLMRLGATLSRQSRFEESDRHLQRALSLLDRPGGDDPVMRISVLATLAQNAYYVQPPTNGVARALYLRALALLDRHDKPSQRYDVEIGLARIDEALGEPASAEQHYRAAIELGKRMSEYDHANALQLYADMIFGDRYEEGLALMTRAIAMLQRTAGEHVGTADALQSRGRAYATVGHLREAQADLERAVAMYTRLRGADDVDRTLDVQLALAHLKISRGDIDGADELLRPVMATLRAQEAQHGYRLGPGLTLQGMVAEHRRQWDTAQALYDEALRRAIGEYGADSLHAVSARVSLARLLIERGRPAQGRLAAQAEVAAAARLSSGGGWMAARAELQIARAWLAEGDLAQAGIALRGLQQRVAEPQVAKQVLIAAETVALSGQWAERAQGCAAARSLYADAASRFETIGVQGGRTWEALRAGIARCSAASTQAAN